MNGEKNILIVYAHQEPKSFNAALKDEAVSTLAAQGHNVTVSDLCQLKFDPVDYPHYFKGKWVLLYIYDGHLPNCIIMFKNVLLNLFLKL